MPPSPAGRRRSLLIVCPPVAAELEPRGRSSVVLRLAGRELPVEDGRAVVGDAATLLPVASSPRSSAF
jgi:hypothetical protein